MPDNTEGQYVVVRDATTGALTRVPLAEHRAAVESGRYVDTEQSTVRTRLGDVELADPAAVGAAHVAGGLTPVTGARAGAEAQEARFRESHDTMGDKALTFAEGVVDAMSLGLLHEHGSVAETRRDVNSGSAFAGQLVGTALGLKVPGVGTVANAGRRAGQGVARALLGEVKTGSLAARAAGEAGLGAALMAATSVGHQVSDAVIDDKPFAAEAVLTEAGLGSLLGGAFGFTEGTLARFLGRGRAPGVLKQGGLLDAASTESKEVAAGVREGIAALNDAAEQHARRIGVLEVLAREGKAPRGLVDAARKQLARVERGRERLALIDPEAALSGADEALFKRWNAIRGEYEAELVKLDELAVPEMARMARAPMRDARLPGPAAQHGPPTPTWAAANEGAVSPMSIALDDVMAGSRLSAKAGGARAGGATFADDFERIYGRPWEELGAGDSSSALPKGKVTPTSEAGTNAARPGRGRRPPVDDLEGVPELDPGTVHEPAPRGPLTAPPRGRAIASEVDRPGPFTEVGRAPGQEPYRPPVAEVGTGRGPGDIAVGDQVERPLLQRWGEHPDLLGNAVHPHDQVLMRDGRILPARSVRGNADDFARFRERSALTEAPPAPADRTVKGGGPHREVPLEQGPEVTTRMPAPERRGADAVDRFLDNWAAERRARGGSPSPGDRAAARLASVMDRVREGTGGRLDSAAALDFLKREGVPAATSTWGEQLNQLYAVRRIARAVSEEARGRATPLRRTSRDRILQWLGTRASGNVGARLGRQVAGGAVGGPLGWVLGAQFANKLFGFTAGVASTAGRLNTRIVEVAHAVVNRSRATAAARSWRAVSGNHPVAYSDAGPIQDPVERVAELRRVAGNPVALRAHLESQLGDAILLHPEVARHLLDQAVGRTIQLSLKAPAVYWDRLGRLVGPGEQAMRRFLEFENATHDLDGLLSAVASGRASDAQLEALRVQHPGVYHRFVREVLADPAALAAMPRDRLRDLERTIGMPLTPGADPGFVYRQQQAWQMTRTPPTGPAPAGGPTSPRPTPGQAGARAPGN